MNFRDALPTLFEQTNLKDHPIWTEQFFYDENSFDAIMDLVKSCLRDCDINAGEELQVATAVCSDIIAFPQRPPSVRLMADFLKFQICTLIMNIEGRKRLNHPLFHWIANSVSATVHEDGEREVHGGWILDFAESELPYIKKNFKLDFIQWTNQLFYYMRVMGGHQQLTAYYLDNLLELFFGMANRAFYYKDLDVAAGQILTWASNNHIMSLKERAAGIKMYLYNSTGYPEEWRKNIEFGFACTGYEYTGRTQKEWIDLVLEKRTLIGHERLQLLSQKYQGNAACVIAGIDELMSAIDEYHSYLSSFYREDQLANYELSRIYSLLMPAVLALLQEGQVEIANKLIGHYFNVEYADLIASTNVVIVPGTINGVQYSRTGKVLWSGESPFDHVQELMKCANSFFGWTGVMKDDLSFIPDIPERGSGVPDKTKGPDLESRIVKFYGFNQPHLLKNVSEASAYYLLGNYQLPLQPLMVKYGGFAIPMIQSFRKPLPARSIENVFIWQGDSRSSEDECDAVQQLFENAGANVKRLNWHASSKEEFLQEYYRQDFDLVWISGHGEFDQFRPHLSSIVLYQDMSGPETQNVAIDYNELQPYKNDNDSRRLLVLNIRDGATTTLDNSPAAIGLGAKMINASQSLISHQWPIDPDAGLVIGFLLANALAEGKSYTESYQESIQIFLTGKETVTDKIRQTLPESTLSDTISRSSAVDFSNLFFYGSLMYAE